MKNILIFIDSSLGELDWIAPFVTSTHAQRYHFSIFFRTIPLTQKIIEDFNLKQENVELLQSSDLFKSSDIKRDKYIHYILKKVKKSKYLHNFFSKFKYRAVATKTPIENRYDFIFRDFNLKESIELNNFILSNPNAKVIVYPHAVGIQRITEGFKSPELRDVKADLWLENTALSTRALEKYSDVFFVSGIPIVDNLIHLNQNNYQFDSNNILILTRDSYKEFGTTREDMLESFEKVLRFCQENSLNAVIKHHPRDKKVEQFRAIQKKFDNTAEYDKSLTNIDIKLRACLSVYSTAGIFLTATKVPVFDFTPYKHCKEKKLIFHYCDDDGVYTHDLIKNGLQNKIADFNTLLKNSLLDTLSNQQFKMLKEHFPLDANRNISNRLQELF